METFAKAEDEVCQRKAGLTRVECEFVPTPEALLLQRELTPFDEELTRVRRLISSLSAGESGRLRVAATPAFAHHLLPSALAQWRKAFPQSTCEISVAHTREILDALLLNEMDFGQPNGCSNF